MKYLLPLFTSYNMHSERRANDARDLKQLHRVNSQSIRLIDRAPIFAHPKMTKRPSCFTYRIYSPHVGTRYRKRTWLDVNQSPIRRRLSDLSQLARDRVAMRRQANFKCGLESVAARFDQTQRRARSGRSLQASPLTLNRGLNHRPSSEDFELTRP